MQFAGCFLHHAQMDVLLVHVLYQLLPYVTLDCV